MIAYIVTRGQSVVITTGELKWEGVVGPGGYVAKVWKTKAGAQRYADRIKGKVQEEQIHSWKKVRGKS